MSDPVGGRPWNGPWLWVGAGAASGACAGATIVMAVMAFAGGAGRGSPGSSPPAPPPAAPAAPGEDGKREIEALRDKVRALEIEVLTWQNLVKEMDRDQAVELGEQIASGDARETETARRVFEARGGLTGKVLGAKVLELRAKIASLEARLSLEREKAARALDGLMEAERKQKAASNAARAEQFYQRALSAQTGGHHELAEQDYTSALEADPGHAGALHGRGTSRFALGRLGDALDDFTRSCGLRPDFAPSHMSRGRVLSALGRFREAEECFDRVLLLEPGNSDARDAKGEARKRRTE